MNFDNVNDMALVYDLFPSTMTDRMYSNMEIPNATYSVFISEEDVYSVVESSLLVYSDLRYYGRALVGDGKGNYTELNAYVLKTGAPMPDIELDQCSVYAADAECCCECCYEHCIVDELFDRLIKN